MDLSKGLRDFGVSDLSKQIRNANSTQAIPPQGKNLTYPIQPAIDLFKANQKSSQQFQQKQVQKFGIAFDPTGMVGDIEAVGSKASNLANEIRNAGKSELSKALTQPIKEVPPATAGTNLLQEAKKYKSAEEFVRAQGTPTFSGSSEITKEWTNERIGNFGTIYRGRNELGGGIYITDSPEYAKTFGSQLTESSLKKNLKLFDVRESSNAIGNAELNKIKAGFDSYDYYLKHGGEKLLPTDHPDEILNKIQEVYGANSTEILKKAGFDGIVGDESRVGGQGGTVWNIFDAKNIKTKSQLTDIWNQANKGSTDIGTLTKVGSGIAGAAGTAGLMSIPNTFEVKPKEQDKISKPPESPGVVEGIDFTSSTEKSYAEDPKHVEKLRAIVDTMAGITTIQQMTKFIKSKFPTSPLNGKIIFEIANQYGISPLALAATLQNDSGYGTKGSGAKNHNPGNVFTYGNRTGTYKSWWDGVDAAAYELFKRKVNP